MTRRGTTLLVAGPAGSDADGLLAGEGLLAAIAAAPLIRVQLWARAGAQARGFLGLLERRGVDASGLGLDGPPVRCPAGSRPAPAPFLPELEPTSAEGLGGSLLLGLDGAEAQRAQAAILTLAPPLQVQVCEHVLPAANAPPTLVVARLSSACRLTQTSDALAAARAIQACGVKSVVITAGMLGGVLVHGELATTYAAAPIHEAPVAGGGRASAVFAGALAGWCVGDGADFSALRRGCGIASAVAGIMVQGGVKRLMAADRAQCLERFNRLRRTSKA